MHEFLPTFLSIRKNADLNFLKGKFFFSIANTERVFLQKCHEFFLSKQSG